MGKGGFFPWCGGGGFIPGGGGGVGFDPTLQKTGGIYSGGICSGCDLIRFPKSKRCFSPRSKRQLHLQQMAININVLSYTNTFTPTPGMGRVRL